MAKYTHDAIMNTFTEMIHEMPFDKITVAELVRRCNISPNTFYYHYKDIYELLGDWLKEGVMQFSSNVDFRNWKEVIKRVLRMCKEHEIATYHIYNSLSRDTFERFAFKHSNDIIKLTILQIAGVEGFGISEEKIQPLA
ncbi:MAG: TetR family transcriptional regulator, partial [Spirochaetales bacterium]|nr:TetR family transcriptional regulator [Spirochaetales bacterium]